MDQFVKLWIFEKISPISSHLCNVALFLCFNRNGPICITFVRIYFSHCTFLLFPPVQCNIPPCSCAPTRMGQASGRGHSSAKAHILCPGDHHHHCDHYHHHYDHHHHHCDHYNHNDDHHIFQKYELNRPYHIGQALDPFQNLDIAGALLACIVITIMIKWQPSISDHQ